MIKTRKMNLDPGTFGGSPAAHIVVDMMKNNVIPIGEQHRVLRLINGITFNFKWASTIQNLSVKSRVMTLLRDDCVKHIDQLLYPKTFKTHLTSVVYSHYRRYLKEVV